MAADLEHGPADLEHGPADLEHGPADLEHGPADLEREPLAEVPRHEPPGVELEFAPARARPCRLEGAEPAARFRPRASNLTRRLPRSPIW